MKIKTKDLQAMVSKVQKGSVANGIAPITGLINISKGADGSFVVRTFDGFCHYRAKSLDQSYGADSFTASVNANLFVNLVAKTTSEEVELKFEGSSLTFEGNGSYKIEVVYDGGIPLDFPSLSSYFDGVTETHALNLKELGEAFSACDVTMVKNVADFPMYSAMNVAERCVSTDNNTACIHTGQVIDSGSVLIPYPALKFIQSFSDAEVEIGVTDDAENPRFHMSDSSFDVCGALAKNHRKFPASVLEGLMSVKCPKVAIKVDEALGAIDRALLFSKQSDERGIFLSFADGVIGVTCIKDTKKTNALSEEIDAYEVGADGNPTESAACIAEPFEAPLDIYYLQSQLRALKSKMAIIGFGMNKYITVSGGNDVYMLSFLALKGVK